MTGMAAATSPVAEPIDPSAALAVEDVAAVEAVIDANPADSSTVDSMDANKPANLLDVVKAAVAKEPEPVASSSPEGDPVAAEAEEAVQTDESEVEDDANLPFHNHPRWKAVIAERDSFKEPAERWGHIDGFMREHGLSGEEVAEGYEVMALLKSGDPAKLEQARGWFHERLTALDGMLGHVLPEDLQTRVDEGFLDEDGAQELAKARAARVLSDAQVATRATAAAEEQQRQDATAITNAMVTAVEAWEERIKASDPDYPKKAKLVLDRSRSIVAATGKPPTTAAEATALADQALAEVTAEFKSALPKPRAIAPTPASTSTVATAQPKTLRDAINGAVGHVT